MSDIVIQAENIGKRYRIGGSVPYKALRDTLTDAATAPWRGLRKLVSPHSLENRKSKIENSFWALKDVNFEVNRGEVVGIIGRNGAGKSTLLKILSRITEPTEGRIELRGRVGSLLEVGTGFHPELTGRENIYLNGAILGMKRAEIARKFDEIVEFSEISKFLDTPVKHYSSGMYMRLAFSVAAHLEPEILLVDEVLAVGDAEFQKKCLGKMGEVAKGGRTVLFVSHNMAAVQTLCTQALWLDAGHVRHHGKAAAIIHDYQQCALAATGTWSRTNQPPDTSSCYFTRLEAEGATGSGATLDGDQAIRLHIHYKVRHALTGCQIAIRLYNGNDVVVFTSSDADGSGFSATAKSTGDYRATLTIPPGWLSPGRHTILAAAHLPGRCNYDVVDRELAFEVIRPASGHIHMDGRLGVVSPLLPWNTEKNET